MLDNALSETVLQHSCCQLDVAGVADVADVSVAARRNFADASVVVALTAVLAVAVV